MRFSFKLLQLKWVNSLVFSYGFHVIFAIVFTVQQESENIIPSKVVCEENHFRAISTRNHWSDFYTSLGRQPSSPGGVLLAGHSLCATRASVWMSLMICGRPSKALEELFWSYLTCHLYLGCLSQAGVAKQLLKFLLKIGFHEA